VLARHGLRLLRAGADVPGELPEAVRELGLAVWELAGAYERVERCEAVGDHSVRAAALASGVDAEIGGQVRSTAVDLRRAADLVCGTPDSRDAPTEELLVGA
jgi:hypothetical protein